VGIAAARGDKDALSLISRAAAHFAVALCNVIALLNPDIIVLGGGVSLMGDIFLNPLRSAVARQVFPPFADRYNIVPAKLGEEAVPAGALLI
ncbi:MAG: ROK family protein, partial [Deltaproteobacteria bacterium]|nr:ROK family protein [Deltaproteobacteria bacterium]